MSVSLRQATIEDAEIIWKMQVEAFTDLLEKYQDYDIIKRIADEENVKILYPKDETFVDLGGIISLWR